MHTDIEDVITVGELKKYLAKHNTNDLVCIRQCDGTDFPPFIAIESSDDFIKTNREGSFVCLSNETKLSKTLK